MLRLKCRGRQLISLPTAAQGFSPGLSSDGSLICSGGGPLRKHPALLEDFSRIVLFILCFYITMIVNKFRGEFHGSIIAKNKPKVIKWGFIIVASQLQ